MLIKDFKSSWKPPKNVSWGKFLKKAKPTSSNKSRVEKLHLEISTSFNPFSCLPSLFLFRLPKKKHIFILITTIKLLFLSPMERSYILFHVSTEFFSQKRREKIAVCWCTSKKISISFTSNAITRNIFQAILSSKGRGKTRENRTNLECNLYAHKKTRRVE